MKMPQTVWSTRLLSLCSLFVLMLAACGGAPAATAPDAATSAATSAASTSANETAAPAAATGGQVTLKYVSWMAKGEDKPILADFMKQYPNIKVEDQVLDGGTYDTLLKPRFTSGDAPDVFLFMASQYAPYVQQGWLMDVTNEPGTQQMQPLKSLADYYTTQSKIYGTMVNGNWSDQPIYYNKKYFAALGITPPTTIDEFMAICEKVKADGKDALVVGGKDPWTVALLPSAYQATELYGKYGGSNTDNKLVKGEVSVDDLYSGPLTFFGDIAQKGYISKASQTLTYDQSVQYFADGKAAMLAQGPWVPGLDAVKQADASQFELGAFSFPAAKNNGKVSTGAAADRSIGIWANTAHPAEAKLLYNFFLAKENLSKYLSSQSLFTLIPGINPEIAPVLQDYVKAHADANQYQVYLGSTDKVAVTFPAAWNDEVGKMYVNVLAGSTSADELATLKDTFDKVKGQVTVTNQ